MQLASVHTINSVATQLNSSLLTLSVIAVLLPAAFHMNVTGSTDSDEGQDILKVSHGVRLILIFYLCPVQTLLCLGRPYPTLQSVILSSSGCSFTNPSFSLRLLSIFPTLLSCHTIHRRWCSTLYPLSEKEG